MAKKIIDKKDSGLPFDIEQDDHFKSNYSARMENRASAELTFTDVILAHILVELKKKSNEQPQ